MSCETVEIIKAITVNIATLGLFGVFIYLLIKNHE